MMKLFPGADNRKYLLFIYKLIILFLILFLLDFSTGRILRHFYFTQKSGKSYRSTYSIENAKADFLVMGSSRANHHYNPAIFEKELGLSYYNAGRDGSYLLYHYAVLRSILKRYSPYVIVLDVRRDEFTLDQFSYDGLSALLPYYRDHPEIRQIVELRGPYEKIKLISSIYPFNSDFFSIAAGNLGLNSDAGKENKGFVPLTKTFNGVPMTESPGITDVETDPVKAAFYDSFIRDCISSGVRLFVICSPYFSVSRDNSSIDIARTTAEKYGISFLDYSTDTAFVGKPGFFADPYHLNETGARLFSEAVAGKIKEKIFGTPDKSQLLRSEIYNPK